MLKPLAKKIKPCSCRGYNCYAIILSLLVFSFVYANIDPVPAGSDTEPVNLNLAQLANSSPQLIQTASISNSGSNNSDDDTEAGSSSVLTGRTALLMNKLMLEEGIRNFEKHHGYTTTFIKQELIDGVMSENQVMNLKLMHAPFSVYMKWLVGDKGQEVLYVAGQNDNKMIVKVGGAKGRFIPPIKLNPTGSTAMKKSRHPITNIGLVNQSKKILSYRIKELTNGEMELKCQMHSDQMFEDRECYCFIIEYNHKDVSPPYRKSVIYLDKEWLVPVCTKNFNWPSGSEKLTGIELDQQTMIEAYSYSNIKMNTRLAGADFSRNILKR